MVSYAIELLLKVQVTQPYTWYRVDFFGCSIDFQRWRTWKTANREYTINNKIWHVCLHQAASHSRLYAKKKINFMSFLFSLSSLICKARIWQREMSDLQKIETKWRADWFSCYFVFLIANIAILLLYTISTVLETHHLVLKAQRNCLVWCYARIKIYRPWYRVDNGSFFVVYRVDRSSFCK